MKDVMTIFSILLMAAIVFALVQERLYARAGANPLTMARMRYDFIIILSLLTAMIAIFSY
jgi:hypothetical protein